MTCAPYTVGMLTTVELTDGERADTSETLSGYQRDRAALDNLREELVQRYPNQWVSVHEGRVFHALEIQALFANLRESGVEPRRVPREFLSKDRPALLL